jgi:hypothetical protein
MYINIKFFMKLISPGNTLVKFGLAYLIVQTSSYLNEIKTSGWPHLGNEILDMIKSLIALFIYIIYISSGLLRKSFQIIYLKCHYTMLME